MIVAKVGWLPHQVVVVGGNCSVTILDAQGTEIFWTAMGGIVTSLVVYDFDGDGENEVNITYALSHTCFSFGYFDFLSVSRLFDLSVTDRYDRL